MAALPSVSGAGGWESDGLCEVESFYDLMSEGADFSYYQDLGPGKYEEHYYNPDGVILFPAARQLYWFGVSHLSVGTLRPGVRGYVPWNLWRKKFVFAYQGNRVSILPYSFWHVPAGAADPMRGQSAVKVAYAVGQRFQRLCDVRPEEGMPAQALEAIASAWKTHRRLKIGVTIGHSVAMFDVRTAFFERGIFSFSSKIIVIPDADATAFSWDRASLGHVCVSTDGTCSMVQEKRPRAAWKHQLAALCPGVIGAHQLLEHSPRPVQEWCRAMLRGPSQMLLRWLAPYEVKQLRCPFTVFVSENT
ncbi:MAG: hypothetical protein HY737_00815 [Candidatus Omnitrophica bacterium]|nr:hypothetical protein [Candidatus Omnitrophota bacterium]